MTTPKNPLSYFDGTDFKHELITPTGMNLIKDAMIRCRRDYAIDLIASGLLENKGEEHIESVFEKFENDLK